jgi:hypothetical protein
LVAPEIGFTGTQEGMSEKQRSSLQQVLVGFFADGARVFRHGDYVSADAQAHAIAKAIGFRVVIHPPSDDSKRAFCQGDAVLTPTQISGTLRSILNLGYPLRDIDLSRCEWWGLYSPPPGNRPELSALA